VRIIAETRWPVGKAKRQEGRERKIGCFCEAFDLFDLLHGWHPGTDTCITPVLRELATPLWRSSAAARGGGRPLRTGTFTGTHRHPAKAAPGLLTLVAE